MQTGNDPSAPAFGGMAGKVLREALSVAPFVSGLIIVLGLAGLGFLLDQFEAVEARNVIFELALVVALCRFAMNGYAGEWGGTVFSSRGGSWPKVGLVSLRFLALSSIWMAPVLLLGWRPELVSQAVGELLVGGQGGKILSLTTLVAALVAFSPPVFLIVSVGSDRFADIVTPHTWRRLFHRRGSDLFLVYAVYLGGLGMTILLCLPALTSLGFLSRDFALFIGFFALSFSAGLGLDLLGRLSGFFAAGGDELEMPEPAAAPHPAPAGEIPPARTVVRSSAVLSATMSARGPAPALVSASVSASPPATPARPVAPGKSPLLDARERVDELETRLESDPDNALATLEELHRTYAPHPLVLHRLTIALAEHGRREESFLLACEALPLCLERGAVRLGAEIMAVHLDRIEAFELNRDTVLALAHDLRRHGDLVAAEGAFRTVFDRDRGERRAVKGLIQIAEDLLLRGDLLEAKRVFGFLAERCGDTPLAVHIRAGLAETERRLSKAS